MYIIYNSDGSINKINLTDYIQKGNNNVNSIFFAIIGKTSDEWALSAYFTLPNGDIEGPITGSVDTETIEDITYSGFSVSISAAITIYEGFVKFSLAASNLQSEVLFTYQTLLTINPSSAVPNTTAITLAQYQSLLAYIQSVDSALKEWVSDFSNKTFEFDGTAQTLSDEDFEYLSRYDARIHCSTAGGLYYRHLNDPNALEYRTDISISNFVSYKRIGYYFIRISKSTKEIAAPTHITLNLYSKEQVDALLGE